LFSYPVVTTLHCFFSGSPSVFETLVSFSYAIPLPLPRLYVSLLWDTVPAFSACLFFACFATSFMLYWLPPCFRTGSAEFFVCCKCFWPRLLFRVLSPKGPCTWGWHFPLPKQMSFIPAPIFAGDSVHVGQSVNHLKRAPSLESVRGGGLMAARFVFILTDTLLGGP